MIFNKDEIRFDLSNLYIQKMIAESEVSLDVDEVLLALNKGSAKFVKDVYGKTITTEEQINWSYIYDKYPRIVEFWSEWEKYSTIPMIQGARKFVNDLKQIVGEKGVQIVTSSPESIIKNKTPWLQELFGIEKVFNVNSEIGPKSMYTKNTILVDDGLHNIDDHVSTGSTGIIFNYNDSYGWNKEERNHPLIHRASNYDQVLKIVKSQVENR